MTNNSNLQLNPRTYHSTLVRCIVPMNVSADGFGFFDYDAVLNNSSLKGLRAEFRQSTISTVTPAPFGEFNGCTEFDSVQASLLLNIVLKNGDRVVSEYPLSSLGLVVGASGISSIKRFNISDIDWSRSYIHPADGVQALIIGTVTVFITVFYKPN